MTDPNGDMTQSEHNKLQFVRLCDNVRSSDSNRLEIEAERNRNHEQVFYVAGRTETAV